MRFALVCGIVFLFALAASVPATLVSVGATIYCPYALTRTPYAFNVTVQDNSSYVCIQSDLYLNVTTPNGVNVQYTPLSCANGVHRFNVTFTQNGQYQLHTLITNYSFSVANCTITYYAPTKRAVPDANPLLLIAVGLLAAFAVAFQRHDRKR
jgi:hypothetical protein